MPRSVTLSSAIMLLLCAGAPTLSPAAPGVSAKAARSGPAQQEQDPETRAAGGERAGNAEQQADATRTTRTYPPTDVAASALDRARPARMPGLDSGLGELARAWAASGDAQAARYAATHGLEWRGGAVRVRIEAGLALPGMRLRDASNRALVEEVLAEVDVRGGRARRTIGPHIEAWVPVRELAALAAGPRVRGIHRPWRMRASETSEGVAVIGADAWQGIEFRSPVDGLAVGVIDLSFTGWESLRGTELPPQERLITRSFRDDGELEAGDEHGTAVAEIIYDLQPDATIYLAAVETLGDISEAINYLVDNGVDVINMSLGCIGCAPGDGRGDAVEVVERAPQQGVPFVTSAGNEADRHWIGPFVDNDNDDLHDFAPGDETNSFRGDAGDEVSIVMNWDYANWFSSAQDLDLVLLDAQGRVVDQSRNRQAGFAGQAAVEEIFLTLPFGGTFHVVVEDVQTSAPQPFELFIEGNNVEHVVPRRSLTVPADGNQVIAVGAVYWANDAPEGFSSRGPTKDGRLKPELGAPDGVTTRSFGPMGFFGTSAAAPHVVGAVALLRGRLGLLSGMDAIQVLTPRLVDLPPVGPDNVTGDGRLSLILPS